MADAPWRVAQKDHAGNVAIHAADVYESYRLAKRAAQERNAKRRHPRPYWVVIAPSGHIANTGAET